MAASSAYTKTQRLFAIRYDKKKMYVNDKRGYFLTAGGEAFLKSVYVLMIVITKTK